jgi:hypothetical protein
MERRCLQFRKPCRDCLPVREVRVSIGRYSFRFRHKPCIPLRTRCDDAREEGGEERRKGRNNPEFMDVRFTDSLEPKSGAIRLEAHQVESRTCGQLPELARQTKIQWAGLPLNPTAGIAQPAQRGKGPRIPACSVSLAFPQRRVDLSEASRIPERYVRQRGQWNPVRHGRHVTIGTDAFHYLELSGRGGVCWRVASESNKQDLSLIYKLLRYLNSPLMGFSTQVRGIRHAISLLGEVEFRRWISIVALVAMVGDKPSELIRTALLRAYFCEEVSLLLGMAQRRSDFSLMGLLSVIDALLDRPMEDILSQLAVSEEVRTALCGGSNRFRDVYDTLLAYEHAD